MGMQNDAIAQFNIGPDNAVGTDRYADAELSAVGDNCCGVNVCHA